MSINLIDIAREHLSEAALKLIGEKVGISPDNISDVVGKLFPSLLGAFGERAKSPEGAEAVFGAVKEDDGGILGDLIGAFSGDTSLLQQSGTNILGSIFGGDGAGSVISKLAGFAGISSEKAGGLVSLLAPVLTGIIGKQVKSNGLDLSGFQSLMKDQDQHIKSVLGEGQLDKLGLGGLLGGLGATTFGIGDKISGFTAGANEKVSGAIGSVNEKVSGVANTVGDKVSEVSGSAGDAVRGAGDKVTSVVSGAGEKVSGTVGAAGDKVSGAVGAAGNTVKGAGAKVGAAASGVGASAKSVGSATADTTKKGGKGILALIPLLLLGLLAFFLIKQCNPGAAIADGIENATDSVVDGAKDLGGAAVDGVKDAGSAIGDGAAALGEGAKDAGSAIGDGAAALGEGAKDLGSAAVDGVKDAGSAIGDGAAALGEGAKDLGSAAVDGVKDAGSAIGDGADAVVDGVKKIGSADAPNLSEKVKAFADKLKGIDASDENALDQVYADFTADGSSTFLYRIPFQTGETGVPNAHQEALIAKLKTADPDATLVTIGYADTRGDDAANKQLSYGRAQEVGTWIKSTLGNDTNIESFSMGETDRFSKSDFAKNRVVEVWQISK